MQLSRPRDDRRRRILADEVNGATTTTPANDDSESADSGLRVRRRVESAKYGESRFMERHPRISDLVPQRFLAFALILVLGLAFIAGLEALYYYMPRLAEGTTDGAIAAFDLDSEGSLGTWFSSVLLGSTALCGLLVFWIRRHKADDYHGRYRIWLWASMVWFVMSVDEAASLHEGFKELMARVSGTRIVGDGSMWWVLGYSLVFLAVGSRLVFQIKACRMATAFYVLAGIGYLAAVATQLELLLPQQGALGIMVEEGLEMTSGLFLLMGTALFARYVILESQGALGARAEKSRKLRSKKEATEATASAKSNDAGSGSKPTLKFGTSTPRHAASGGTGSFSGGSQVRVDSAHDSGNRRLSKAERRAMRKNQTSDRDDD